MKKVLKRLRDIKLVNSGLRVALKKADTLINQLIRRWPITGVVHLNFNGIPFKMYSKGDDDIVSLMYYDKHYHESKDLKLFLTLAKNASVIYDIGANTGFYSCLCGLVNPSAKIYAFEPYPVNIDRLKGNIQLNNVQNVTIVDKALGASEGVISFAVPSDNKIADTSSADIDFSKNSYEGKRKWKTINVEQLSLDQFFAEHHAQVDLMKIDVEGYEKAVFQGGKEFFKTQSALVQCEIFLDEEKKAFFEQFLKDTGYYAYLMLNDGLLLTGQTLIKNPGSINYLFAKNQTQSKFISYNNIENLLQELKQV